MCSSTREFGSKIPCRVRSNDEFVDGHLRLKAARKLGIAEIPAILRDEWTEEQVRLSSHSESCGDMGGLGRRTLSLELQESHLANFDLDLTGFDGREMDGLLKLRDPGTCIRHLLN